MNERNREKERDAAECGDRTWRSEELCGRGEEEEGGGRRGIRGFVSVRENMTPLLKPFITS